MPRHLLLTTGCALTLLLCSCNGQKGGRSVEEITTSLYIEQADSTICGTLYAVTYDSLKFTSEFGGEHFSCTYNAAQAQQDILGSLTEGNRYAVLLNTPQKAALKILNLTELSGQWFFDDEPESGLCFTAAGALSSINNHDVCFKKWKHYNGQIIIFYAGMEDAVNDSRQYKSDTTEITNLSADALSFRFLGAMRNCHRQKEAIKVKFNF